MKTIAQLPNSKVLVELTKDELSNICGFYTFNSMKENIQIGVEIDISDIYKKHRLIKELQETQEYNKARAKLEKMLEALTPIEDKIDIIKLPE